MQAITKPYILDVVQAEGLELKQRGRSLWALCPFHSEVTPSFCVDQERQHWKCFGCGASGDSREIKSDPLKLKKRELIEKFKEWCCNYTKYLCERLRVCNQIDSLVKTSESLELKGLSEMYLLRDICRYHLFILNDRENETKFKLYKEVCYGNRI